MHGIRVATSRTLCAGERNWTNIDFFFTLKELCIGFASLGCLDHRFFFEDVDSFIANFRFTGNKVSEYVRIVRFVLILLACDRLY